MDCRWSKERYRLAFHSARCLSFGVPPDKSVGHFAAKNRCSKPDAKFSVGLSARVGALGGCGQWDKKFSTVRQRNRGIYVGLENTLIVDFHMHSHCSDGQLTPQQLVELAVARGCEQIAITDHDSIAAYAQLSEPNLPVKVVPGCEFSANWRGREIHIVGLNLDLHNPMLLDGIEHQQRAVAAVPNALANCLLARVFLMHWLEPKRWRQGAVWGGPHFARYLVEWVRLQTLSKHSNAIWPLANPAYVRTQWAEIVQVCHWIKAAGGVAVLATR